MKLCNDPSSPSEDLFVMRIQNAIANSVRSGEEFQYGGGLSSLPRMFQRRDVKLDMTDFLDSSIGTLDYRLLKAWDNVLILHPADRFNGFLRAYDTLLRSAMLWPSAFEFNWISKRLGHSTEFSKPIKLLKMTVDWDRMVGTLPNNGFVMTDRNDHDGRVDPHSMRKAEEMVQETFQDSPYLDRCILLVHYGYAAVNPFPGNQYLGRDNVSRYFPGRFVESLYTFLILPTQSGGLAPRAIPRRKKSIAKKALPRKTSRKKTSPRKTSRKNTSPRKRKKK